MRRGRAKRPPARIPHRVAVTSARLVAGLSVGVLLAGTAVRARAEPVHVVSTIHPLTAIVDAVGGEAVSALTLLPPGASPHAYDPVPSDLIGLSRADLLITVGGGLDAWADRLQSAIESKPIVVSLAQLVVSADRATQDADRSHSDHDHSRGHGHGHGESDHDEPHLWLDPLFVADRVVPAVAAAIIAAGAEDPDYIAANARKLVNELHELDTRIRAILAGAGTKEYIAFHNAWGHFAARYDLDELGVLEEAGGEEPTPRAIAALIRSAREHGVRAILVEPQLPPRVAEIIAAEFGGTTVMVDPIGAPQTPGRTSYVELMQYNAEGFARALATGGSDE